MALWVLSDLHLADDSVVSMFHAERQGAAFSRLCERIAAERDAELVLLGDVFDLTAMERPPADLAAFGRKVGVSLPDVAERSVAERCAAVRRKHDATLRTLAELAERVPVTLVPGNHDRALASDDGRAALDAAGLERVSMAPEVVRTLADLRLVMRHGHELDEDNAAPGGRGEMLTRVMHHAVVPMLERVPPRAGVRIDPVRLVALRPEERMVPVLERWLSPKRFEAFTEALLDLLVEVGALSRAAAWLATPERLREKLDDADDLWERTGRSARALLDGEKVDGLGRTRPDVLVLGHTHVPDWVVDDGDDAQGRRRLYVNLGSWTDRATDAVGPLDTLLPVLRIEARTRGLVATSIEASSGDVLDTFDASVAAPPGQR